MTEYSNSSSSESQSAPCPAPQVQQNPPRQRSGCATFGCVMSVILGGILLVICLLIGGCLFLGIGAVSSVFSSDDFDLNTLAQKHSFIKEKHTEEVIGGNPSASAKIAVIDICGIITSDSGTSYQEIASSEDICTQLRRAANDPKVKAVILNLNTPGGEVTAADEIYHEVIQIQKPVVAMMNSLAASGGYYIAAGCDSIVANRLTLTGSIGVIIQTYNYSGLFEKVGLKSEAYTSGPMKNMLDGAAPSHSEEEVKIIQTLVRNTYLEFAKIVSTGRNIPLETITKTAIGDGRIFDGQQALELKLVDKLGYFEDAEETAAELAEVSPDTYKLVRYSPSFSLASLFQASAQEGSSIQVNFPGTQQSFKLKKGTLYFLPSMYR